MPFDLTALNNNYVVIFCALFLTAYAYAASKMKLPNGYVKLFDNGIFRLVILALLLMFNKVPHVAITIALIYVLTIFYMQQYDTKENFAYMDVYKNEIMKGRRKRV
jgi:hypothetical protein